MKEKLKNKLIEKFGNNKKLLFAVAVGILGMLLILLSETMPSEKKASTRAAPEQTVSYEESVEKKLKKIIESIDGAGEAEVMIVFSSSKESVFAKDTDEDFENGESGGTRKTKSKYIIVENDEGESGLLTKAVYPVVNGVAIVCDGAGDSVIKQRIVETVSALFDINSKNISVVRKAG